MLQGIVAAPGAVEVGQTTFEEPIETFARLPLDDVTEEHETEVGVQISTHLAFGVQCGDGLQHGLAAED